MGRTRILRWLGRKNQENVARTRNCCGWPSSHDQIFKKWFIFRDGTVKKIIGKNKDIEVARTKKMRKMWLGREIVVAGLSPMTRFFKNLLVNKLILNGSTCIKKYLD